MGGVALVPGRPKRMVVGGGGLREDGGDAPRQDPFANRIEYG
jgi:hypothetical protein